MERKVTADYVSKQMTLTPLNPAFLILVQLQPDTHEDDVREALKVMDYCREVVGVVKGFPYQTTII